MSDFEPEVELTARVDRRRRRATITLVSLALVLFFAFWYAFSYYRSATAPGATATAVPCVTISKGSVVASTTKVNVYNATRRNGLAASTARQLQDRGFVIGAIANDPKHKKVTAPAEIRYGPKGAKRADLVSALIGKGVVKVNDRRRTQTVDLVLGSRFTSLLPAPSASPTPTCTPTGSPSGSPSTSASPTTT